VIAKVGDEVAGVDLTITYIADIEIGVAANDQLRTAFRCVLTNASSSQTWYSIVANTSVAGNLHRLQDVDHHPFPGLPEIYTHLDINNDNLVLGWFFTGDTGSGELNGTVGYTFDADVTGGTFSNLTSSRKLVFDGRCDECVGEPPGTDVCIDGHHLALDDDGNAVILGIRSENASLCDYDDADPSYVYVNPPDSDLFWNNIAQLPDGTGYSIPMAGNTAGSGQNPQVVVHKQTGAQEDILYVGSNGTMRLLASTAHGWADLGNFPGMSADGVAVAFGGSDPTGGIPGIYLAIDHPNLDGGFTYPVLDTNTDVAIDNNTNKIRFASFDYENHRIPVIHHDVGNDGDIIGDRFISTPTSASLRNPALPGNVPLLFSGQKGLWTVQFDAEIELAGSNLVFNTRAILPVIQVGDTIDGHTVLDIDLWNGLGRGTVELSGGPRLTNPDSGNPPTRRDHVIYFWVQTTGGSKVIRAGHLDSDEDGLPDHWERFGGGIDIDRDGIIDLDLSDWGANVYRRDLFLELDWLTPRTSGYYGPWRNDPYHGVVHALGLFFADAPLLNPDNSLGITLHVDAGETADTNGPPASINTGTGILDGGDYVAEPGTGLHIDVVYFGSNPAPGIVGLVTRSMEDIKRNVFGQGDKWARELVFRYGLLADFIDIAETDAGVNYLSKIIYSTANRFIPEVPFPNDPTYGNMHGGYVKIIEGVGAGQIRKIDRLNSTNNNVRIIGDWSVTPDHTSKITLLGSYGGVGEAWFNPEPNNHSLAGNDLILSLAGFGQSPEGFHASPQDQYDTLVHELGHTLGLRHGGTDHCAFKGNDYRSLMSYSHLGRNFTSPVLTNECAVPPQVATNVPPVYGLSSQSDPTFDDLADFEFSVYDQLLHIGSSLLSGLSIIPADEMDEGKYTDRFGVPPDSMPPVIEVLSPGGSTNHPLGTTMEVTMRVRDGAAVTNVSVVFDLNGDGDTNGPGEIVTAALLGGDLYSVAFTNVSGSSGPRSLHVTARDRSGNTSSIKPDIFVGAGDSGDHMAPFIDFLNIPFASSFEEGRWIRVLVNVSDFRDDWNDGQTEFVFMSIDADGNGTVDPHELVVAYEVSPLNYQAVLPAISLTPNTRVITVTAYDDWLNKTTASRTINIFPLDKVSPVVNIINPAPGQMFGQGDVLSLAVTITDDGSIVQRYATFDVNGNGTNLVACEQATLASQGGNQYGATFNACGGGAISGPPGLRDVVVYVRDFGGNLTVVTQQVEIIPDMKAPTIQFTAPEASALVGIGHTVTARVTAVDNVTVQVVSISFDINGDGVVSGATEIVNAVKLTTNLFQATLGPVSGPIGPREISATASDGNTNSVSVTREVVVAVGGVFRAPPELTQVAPSGSDDVIIEVVPGQVVSNVLIRFDLNGDGDTDDEGESMWMPKSPGIGRFAFTLLNITGPPGIRTVYVDIIDAGVTTNTISLLVEVLPPDEFLGVRSSHVGWVPNLPESLADGTLSGSAPLDFVPAYAFLYFTARDGVSGRELWRTDGSGKGTRLVEQLLSAGDVLEENASEISEMIAFGDQVFFAGTDFIGDFTLYSEAGLVGNELWSSDGTPGQIQLVKDLLPPATTTTQPPGESDPEWLAEFGGRIWFTARTASNGWQLGVSDGTGPGTSMILLDPVFPGPVPELLTAAESALFFAVKSGTELWKTDGTDTGAVMVLGGFSANGIREIKAVGPRIFFNANEDLWVSDGTPSGTHMTKKIKPAAVAFPQELTVWSNELYFTADDGTHGRELWRSDGTSNGTVLVHDLIPGSVGSTPTYLTVYNDALYFAGEHLTFGRELWRSDGTSTGTAVVVDIAPYIGTTPGGFSYPRRSSSPQHLMVFQNHLYFSADDGQGRIGRELYRTDGTAEGTELVRDMMPGLRAVAGNAFEPESSNPQPVAIHDGLLYFTALTGHQTELWKTDGTSEGTRMVRNIYQAEPKPLYPVWDSLYFSASDLTHGRELWRATSSGVHRVADLFAGVSNGTPYDLILAGSNLFFSAVDRSSAIITEPTRGLYVIQATSATPVKLHSFVELGNPLFPPQPLPSGKLLFRARNTNGVELWISDGSPAGTSQLKDIHPGTAHSNPGHPQLINGHVWFAASNAAGWGVWKTDGTATGTLLVADINPGTPDAAPGRFTAIDGNVVFVGYHHAYGAELWTSDGTATGTALVADLWTGTGSSFTFNTALMLNPFTLFQGSLYARVFDNTLQGTLWKSDGTSTGTVKVGSVDPGSETEFGNIEEFFEHDGWLYFAGERPHGIELHRTDGTTNELVVNLAGLNPSASFEGHGHPRDFVEINGKLLFTAFHWTHGRELWTSAGVFDSTFMLKNIHPFRHHADIAEMTVIGSNLYFVATEGRFGRELWMTDGTEEGTMIVEDLAPGPMSSNPRHLTVVDGVLYYYADAGGHHLSLRRLVPGDSLYDQWLAGTGLSGADRDLFADPNGNHLANLHEFLLGTDPEDPMSTIAVVAPLGVDTLTGESLFEFSYVRHEFAIEYGLDVVVEVSGDLVHWRRASIVVSTTSSLGSGYERVTVRITAPLPLPNPGFARLRHP